IGRAVLRREGIRQVPDRQSLQPYMAGADVDATDKERFAVAGTFPGDVVALDAWLDECRSATVAAGMDEKDVTGQGDGLSRIDAPKRVPGRAVTTTGARHHVEGPSTCGQRRQRPRRYRQNPTIRATVRVEQVELDLIGCVRVEK